MKQTKSLLRVGAALSSAVLLASFADLSAFAASEPASTVFVGDGFEVDYAVTGQWNQSYQCEMTIRNTGSETIHDWCLAFPSEYNYSQIWNGTAEFRNGITLLHNCGYNQDIPADDSVSVGFILDAEELNIPEKYALIGEPEILSADAYETEFTVIDAWDGGYTAALKITNNTDQLLEDWALEFDWDHAIDTVWDAELLGQEDTHYLIGNAGYNQNIKAGESVTISLQGTTEAEVASEPENIVITEYGIARSEAINTLLNVRDVTIDVTGLAYNDEGYYFLNDYMDAIHGTIRPGLLAESASYSIENAAGTVLFSGSFAPVTNWTIPDIGFVIGMNKVTVNVSFSDGNDSETTVWIANFNEENMKNVPIDEGDNDEDGLINYLETVYGTDPEKADTDGDGLSDYLELTVTRTNPLVVDTDKNGTPDGEEDPDRDGLGSAAEVLLGTDPRANDTDGDLLMDGDEVNEYGTDPLKKDTDGDGADDGWELRNGYDPLKAEESFTNTEIVQGDTNSAEITVVTKDGSAATLTATASGNTRLNGSIPGYMGSAFDFEMDGEFERAVLKITFDPEYLKEEGLAPVIYYFNEETQQLEEIQTEWDGVSNYVTAVLPHFSTYIVLNKNKFDTVFARDIELPHGSSPAPFEFVFAIDRSGSMGPQGINNDPQNIRLTVAKNFVDKLDEDDKAAVLAFGQGVSVLASFTNDKAALKAAINKVGNTDYYTHIGAAISTSLAQFGAPNGNIRYIVLLTDGKSDDQLPSDYAATAKEKDVQIITIGLGHSIDANLLKKIAKNTDPKGGDGLYYYASTANDLISTFDDMEKDVKKDDPYKDSNNDGITDAQTLAFCNGTLTTSLGENPLSGYSYEQIQNDMSGDIDGDGIKNGAELKNFSKYTVNGSNVGIISWPNKKDSDSDGLTDSEENSKGTDPLHGDFYKGDVDTLLYDDLFLASLMSNDYLENDWLKFQLFAGNLIFGGFNIDYVDDYEQQLTQMIYIMNTEMANEDATEIIKYSVGEDLNKIAGNVYTVISNANTATVNLAGYADDLATMESAISEMVSIEASMRSVDSLVEAEGMLTEYLTKKTVLEAARMSAQSKYARAANSAEAIKMFDGDGLATKLSKFTTKIPAKLQTAMKALDAVGTAIDAVTTVLQTGAQIASDVRGFSYLCSEEVEFGKAYEMLNAIIDYSDNSDMRTAARNLKTVMANNYESYLHEAWIITENVVGGAAKFGLTYALGHAGPVGFAIGAGLAIGDLLFHTGSIDTQSLATISMGDLGVSYRKYVQNKLSEDGVVYYTISGDNYYRLSVLSQIRIVGENEFYETADNYNWLYDKLTGIKTLTQETAGDNIRSVWNFTKSSPLVVSNPNYEGHTVSVS